ncbi:hypothetical protein ACP70R_011980 [Stipagrostis hirtigluma subsp. patula]
MGHLLVTATPRAHPDPDPVDGDTPAALVRWLRGIDAARQASQPAGARPPPLIPIHRRLIGEQWPHRPVTELQRTRERVTRR